MHYHSGKGRLKRHIAPVILARLRERGLVRYAEPFAGMLSVGLAVLAGHPGVRARFGDTNCRVVELFRAVARGWVPDARPLSARGFARWRNRRGDSPQRTFYGYNLSMRGEFFGCRRPNAEKNTPRALAGLRDRLVAARPLLRRAALHCEDYRAAPVPERTLIYCDPPYFGAAHHGWDPAQEAEFWDHVRRWLAPARANAVLVSCSRALPARPGLRARVVWAGFQRSFGARGRRGGRMERLYEIRLRQ